MKYLLLAIVIITFAGCTRIGSYEGMSAQEWYDEYTASHAQYQQLYECVEYYQINDYGTPNCI